MRGLQDRVDDLLAEVFAGDDEQDTMDLEHTDNTGDKSSIEDELLAQDRRVFLLVRPRAAGGCMDPPCSCRASLVQTHCLDRPLCSTMPEQ